MGRNVEDYVNSYFEHPVSFLTTEIMTLYLDSENPEIKIKCLELLSKIEG